MHKVYRIEKPKSLNDNADQWTTDLLEQIFIQGCYKKVDKKYKEKYRTDDVLEALRTMYSDLCCFCESTLNIQTYDRIEHLKPKSVFPELSFEWKNLNLVCEICNTSYKGDLWNPECPFLDPSADKISQFLELNLINGKYQPINNDIRAIYTIEHTGLNRKKLVEKRNQIIDYCIELYKKDGKKRFVEVIPKLVRLTGYPTTYQTISKHLP